MAKEIKAYFVLPSHCEDELGTSEIMQEAFETCRLHRMSIEWVREKDVADNTYEKKDVVVFEKFEGEAFNKLCNESCVIVGPRCLQTCLVEGLKIPNNNAPIYNMAMGDMRITLSGMSVEEKKNLKQKIGYMGGICFTSMFDNIQFLVAKGVISMKYRSATDIPVPILTEKWVDAIWEISLEKNIRADDPSFLEKYKCPPFYNLLVSSTGFNDKERLKIQNLITPHGGKVEGKMSRKTHLLICKTGVKSEKFQAAQTLNIPCVSIEWIENSLKAGYALKLDNYKLHISASTPTKLGVPEPNFSMMSMISGGEKRNISMSSINASCISMCPSDQTLKGLTPSLKNNDPVMNIDLSAVKAAGHFLDGCGVYIAGFGPANREKLCRILKLSGATRYEDISDRITQVIAGDVGSHELKVVATKGCSAPIVSVEWLIESIKRKQPVSEEPYQVTIKGSPSLDTPSSPLVKKGLNLLRANTSTINPNTLSKRLFDDEPADDPNVIMKQYLNVANNEEEEDTLMKLLAQGDIDPPQDALVTMSEDDTNKPIFLNKTFIIIGFDSEETEELTCLIEQRAGFVKSPKFRGVPDYAIVSMFYEDLKQITATEIVNDIWVNDCDRESKVVDIEYFHQPVERVNTSKPLESTVVAISIYAKGERMFLRKLLDHLGALYQDKFSKSCVGDVQISTHLVCKEPNGKKYQAAVAWKVPVVTHDWVLECVRLDCKANEKMFDFKKNNEKTHSDNSKQIQKQDNLIQNTKPQLEISKKKTSTTELNFLLEEVDNRESPEHSAVKRKRLDFTVENISVEKVVNVSIHTNTPGPSKPPEPIPPTTSGDEMPILIDNEYTTLNKFMQNLRDQGCFDPGSPVTKYNVSPYVVPEYKSLLGTPTNSDANYQPSQDTPVANYIRSLQQRKILPSIGQPSTPDSPLPPNIFEVKTPDTPLGAFMCDNKDPSPETRKYWQRKLNNFPHYNIHDRPPLKERRNSTPYSEFKRKIWKQLLGEDETETPNNTSTNKRNALKENGPNDEDEDDSYREPPEETESQKADSLKVTNQLKQLQEMMKSNESSGRRSLLKVRTDTPQRSSLQMPQVFQTTPQYSQPDMIGWENPSEPMLTNETDSMKEISRKFLMTGITQDQKGTCEEIVRSLGGIFSNLSNFDLSITHLVCEVPLRNEKFLSSMANGKYIIHHSYLIDSKNAGKFLDEELYEFGNPKCKIRVEVKSGMNVEAPHWWRKKISVEKHGAFHEMRILLFSTNKEMLARLVRAGDGVIVNAEPPFEHNIEATHCLIDMKLGTKMEEFIPLAKQGIQCLNIKFLSVFLNCFGKVNNHDYIPIELQNYY